MIPSVFGWHSRRGNVGNSDRTPFGKILGNVDGDVDGEGLGDSGCSFRNIVGSSVGDLEGN